MDWKERINEESKARKLTNDNDEVSRERYSELIALFG